MKVSKVYEVWVGGDMLDDGMTFNAARVMAEDALREELKEEVPADVVIDEHSYFTIESFEDLDKLGA